MGCTNAAIKEHGAKFGVDGVVNGIHILIPQFRHRLLIVSRGSLLRRQGGAGEGQA